jgi:CheY-like chemotaxis protein
VVTDVDGANAGVAALGWPLDLVLMDMQKPKLGDLAATRSIRARVET